MKSPIDWQELRLARAFAGQLYSAKLKTQLDARLRGDPLARVGLTPWHGDPYPLYDQVRERGELSRGRLPGTWVTATHAVCKDVLKNRDFGTVGREGVGRESDEFDLSMLEKNPPDHTRLRRVAAPAFTPRRMASYETSIDKTVHSMLDRVPAGETFDLQRAVSAPLPINVISDLLGVPDADADRFTRYGTALGKALDGIKSMRHAHQAYGAKLALERMFSRLLQERAADPRDDLLSVLAAERGETIRPEEILPLCQLLLVAGFETTVNLIGNAVHALLRHPGQWQLLVDDPSLAAAAIEETLRWDPPIQFTSRVAMQETEIANTVVKKGYWVVTALGGANRDPAAFGRPNDFDITRTDGGDHLAFSSGIHYCLGAGLARLEGEIALRAIAERMPRLHLAGKVPMRRTTTIRGVRSLPVRA
ncbi:cytochrome P450 [Flexivirga meconopsidis]|uniref:cytochrome P450 n=1 Tax=Flexivirga meconopsidis TaxID=2977121 RepID=UPI00223F1326